MKCDNERPICATCRTFDRDCTWTGNVPPSSRKQVSPQSDIEIMQNRYQEIDRVQFDRLRRVEVLLEKLLPHGMTVDELIASINKEEAMTNLGNE